MNVFLWIVVGGMLGWVGYRFWGLNEHRGLVISIIIGAVGGLLGGHEIAPVFLSAAAIPGNFSTAALFFAAAIAATFLFVGNLVYDRWGV